MQKESLNPYSVTLLILENPKEAVIGRAIELKSN